MKKRLKRIEERQIFMLYVLAFIAGCEISKIIMNIFN